MFRIESIPRRLDILLLIGKIDVGEARGGFVVLYRGRLSGYIDWSKLNQAIREGRCVIDES
jgi:hypothetical protein